MNLVQEMATMNKAELLLFSKIEKALNFETNEAVLMKEDKKTTKVLSIGYRSLKEKNLVKRIKGVRSYMVNPKLIIPSSYDTAIRKWESIK